MSISLLFHRFHFERPFFLFPSPFQSDSKLNGTRAIELNFTCQMSANSKRKIRSQCKEDWIFNQWKSRAKPQICFSLRQNIVMEILIKNRNLNALILVFTFVRFLRPNFHLLQYVRYVIIEKLQEW